MLREQIFYTQRLGDQTQKHLFKAPCHIEQFIVVDFFWINKYPL
jgi:hypothetical protein